MYLIPKAIRYAIKKEAPYLSDAFISPAITKANKIFLYIEQRKVVNFKSEAEAQSLFELQYGNLLDMAVKKEVEQPLCDFIFATYDLCKFDRKMIIEEKEYCYNQHLLFNFYDEHCKADDEWMKLNKVRLQTESNFNISNNNATGIINQTKFLNPIYEPYINNPLNKDLLKDIDLGIISYFKEDNHLTARVLMEINKISYDLSTFKNNDEILMLTSIKSMKNYLNSDRRIDRKMIIKSFFSHIAILYKKLNYNGISDKELKNYINTASKFTIFHAQKTDIFTLNQLENFKFREVAVFNNLRLLGYSEKDKFKKNLQSIQFMEEYFYNINTYLKSHKI